MTGWNEPGSSMKRGRVASQVRRYNFSHRVTWILHGRRGRRRVDLAWSPPLLQPQRQPQTAQLESARASGIPQESLTHNVLALDLQFPRQYSFTSYEPFPHHPGLLTSCSLHHECVQQLVSRNRRACKNLGAKKQEREARGSIAFLPNHRRGPRVSPRAARERRGQSVPRDVEPSGSRHPPTRAMPRESVIDIVSRVSQHCRLTALSSDSLGRRVNKTTTFDLKSRPQL